MRVFLAVILLFPTSPAFAAAAVVFGSSNGQCWATGAYNDATKLEAIGEAMKECNKRGPCVVAMEYENACAAIAVSPLCSWNAAARTTIQQAQAAALNSCNVQGNGPCRIYTAACDTIPETSRQDIAAIASTLETQKQQLSSELRNATAARDKAQSDLVLAKSQITRLETSVSTLQSRASYNADLIKQRDDAQAQLHEIQSRGLGELIGVYAANSWRSITASAARALSSISDTGTGAGRAVYDWGQASWSYVRDLPTSTHIAGGVAVLSSLTAMTAVAFALRRSAPTPEKKRRRSMLHKLRKRWIALLYRVRRYQPPEARPAPAQTTPPPMPSQPANLPVPVPAFLHPQQPIENVDTLSAQRALQLAASYIAEADADHDRSDEQAMKSLRTTLSLAAKQLDLAHRCDPNAKLEIEDDAIPQSFLRAKVLTLEALSWFPLNQSKGIAVIERATHADPTYADAWRWRGWMNYEMRNQGEAVSCLQRSLELDPDNINVLKLLDRATNLTAAEIATFKVTHARDNVVIATAKTVDTARTIWRVVYAAYGIGFIIMILSGVNSALASALLPFYLATLIPLLILRLIMSYIPGTKANQQAEKWERLLGR